ncbi:uncharacterized protein LOC113133505 isoform X2 [Mastacembelus armatus]|nr:uncharacterized protein LOC113133505 isoform X2 [Mastacembelus armatus]
MWMLREDRGMVDIVFKISQFFPSKLPQYQGQCSQRELVLMRKNHLDFKALAQTLAMDKDKLEDYRKKQMEEHYGEHYAQKVEERLLHYLNALEAVLPGDTYIDKILKKESPVTEEEKLLLEIVTSDSKTLTATLKKLLHCDFASCHQARVSQSSEYGENDMDSSQHSKSVLYSSSSKALLKSVEDKTPLEFQPGIIRGREEAAHKVSKDSHLLFGNDLDVRGHQQTKRDGKEVKTGGKHEGRKEVGERSSVFSQEAAPSLQFCSKHKRWVKSILQECPDELLPQASVSSSPLLFQSSSSASSSQELSPSIAIPYLTDQKHPPLHTVNHLQTAAKASEQPNPKDKHSSGSLSDTCLSESLPQSSSTSALSPPVGQLIDIVSVRSSHPTFKHHQASPHCFTTSSDKPASTPQLLICHHNSLFGHPESVDAPNTTYNLQTSPAPQDVSTFTSYQSTTLPSFSRLSRKYRQPCTSTRQALDHLNQNCSEQLKKAPATFMMSCLPLCDLSVTESPTCDRSPSTSHLGTLSSVCSANPVPSTTKSSPQIVLQNSIQPHPQTHSTSHKSKTIQCSTTQLRLSLPSQAVLLQSALLQPCVSLTRISAQECYQLTKGRSSYRNAETGLQDKHKANRVRGEEDAGSTFDVNILYSSHSSSSNSEDSIDCDPDYKPCIKRKRLLFEYETVRSLNSI